MKMDSLHCYAIASSNAQVQNSCKSHLPLSQRKTQLPHLPPAPPMWIRMTALFIYDVGDDPALRITRDCMDRCHSRTHTQETCSLFHWDLAPHQCVTGVIMLMSTLVLLFSSAVCHYRLVAIRINHLCIIQYNFFVTRCWSSVSQFM